MTVVLAHQSTCGGTNNRIQNIIQSRTQGSPRRTLTIARPYFSHFPTFPRGVALNCIVGKVVEMGVPHCEGKP